MNKHHINELNGWFPMSAPPPEEERVYVHPEQWVAYRSGDMMIAPHNGHYVNWDIGAEGTSTHWRYLPEDPLV
jgi:hypothetical protein